MMTAQTLVPLATSLVSLATSFALVVLSLAFLLTVYRIIKGPGLPDRVIGLDMLVGIAIGFIAVIAIKTGFMLYIDIAISLGLVGFLATVAFARFILSRAASKKHGDAGILDGDPMPDEPIVASPAKIAKVKKTDSGSDKPKKSGKQTSAKKTAAAGKPQKGTK
jgi:multicomponent Na+:H+ antiporter subunit F